MKESPSQSIVDHLQDPARQRFTQLVGLQPERAEQKPRPRESLRASQDQSVEAEISPLLRNIDHSH